jgi:hypothetical protein
LRTGSAISSTSFFSMKLELVAGHETGLVDQVGRVDRAGLNRKCETVTEPAFFES